MSKTNRLQSEKLKKRLKLEKKLSKEEIIALNKAEVAKFHPEPDFSTSSKIIAKERSKIKHEKNMLERASKIWHSVVSVPMGGMKK